MSKDLEDMAKKMLAMSQKKGGGVGIKNSGKPGPSSQLPPQVKKDVTQTVKNAEPTNATQKPAKNKAAQPKKNVAEEASDLMAEEVAPKPKKVKAAKAPKVAMDAADADAVFTEGPSKTGLPHDLNAEADRIKSKLRAAGEYPPDAPGLGTLERDLPKGGRAVMKEAAELAPGAAEQSVMRGIRDKTIGRMSAKSLGGAALLGGVAGVGLQALMESLDAEEAGDPHEGHLSNSQDHAAIEMADKAANKQTATAINTGRLKPPTKHEPFYEDGNPTDQQKMEDEFAKQLQRYPR